MQRSTLIIALIPVVLSGCGKYIPKLDEVLPDKRTEYRKAETLPDLEVPPDLTTDPIQDRMGIPRGGETATYSTYQERVAKQRQQRELDKAGDAAMTKLENESLLVVAAEPGRVWPKLREFWRSEDFGLNLDDPELGVMETSWHEDNEELVRDRFKLFAEPGEDAGTTVLYISHVGEELVPKGEDLVWRDRPRDEELETRMVTRLKNYLTGETGAAGARVAAVGEAPAVGGGDTTARSREELVELISAGGGKLYLKLEQDFSLAWQSTAQALDRAGVTVDEADKARGVYYVRYVDAAGEGKKKKGVWSRLKFWDKDEDGQYRLSLTGVGDKTEVVVLDADGRWDTSDTAGELLVKLQQELNRIL